MNEIKFINDLIPGVSRLLHDVSGYDFEAPVRVIEYHGDGSLREFLHRNQINTNTEICQMFLLVPASARQIFRKEVYATFIVAENALNTTPICHACEKHTILRDAFYSSIIADRVKDAGMIDWITKISHLDAFSYGFAVVQEKENLLYCKRKKLTRESRIGYKVSESQRKGTCTTRPVDGKRNYDGKPLYRDYCAGDLDKSGYSIAAAHCHLKRAVFAKQALRNAAGLLLELRKQAENIPCICRQDLALLYKDICMIRNCEEKAIMSFQPSMQQTKRDIEQAEQTYNNVSQNVHAFITECNTINRRYEQIWKSGVRCGVIASSEENQKAGKKAGKGVHTRKKK